MNQNLNKGIVSGILGTVVANIVIYFFRSMLDYYGFSMFGYSLNQIPALIFFAGIIANSAILGVIFGILFTLTYDSLKMSYYKKGFVFGLILSGVTELPRILYLAVPSWLQYFSLLLYTFMYIIAGLLISIIYEKLTQGSLK